MKLWGDLMNRGKLRLLILFALIVCIVFINNSVGIYADTYSDGQITVKHEEIKVKRNRQQIQFEHPFEIPANVITNALSYISYEEKGLLKKKEAMRVFQDDEIKKLVPLIIQSFSVAKPTQAVTVSSFSERMLLTDQQNYCVMFVHERCLNIVFSRIHMFQTYNDSMSDKRRHTLTRENPTEISHSRFWKLIPSEGQRLEADHENWLVVDLSEELYQQPVVQRVGTVEEKFKKGTSELDERLKRLEEKLDGVDAAERGAEMVSSEKLDTGNNIKNKLIILREMVNDGIVSEEDYNYKKAKLLREGMENLSTKEQLRTIKDLAVDGLITEDDYNEKKKELLDKF